MNQLFFIETFVLGSAAIAAIYHLVLFIQQRDKFLLSYSVYLFTLTSYILFKLISDNYSPFIETTNRTYFIIEEVLQVVMVCVYGTFAAITLEIFTRSSKAKIGWYIFLAIGAISICIHLYKSVTIYPLVTLRQDYAMSRLAIITIASISLIFAWYESTTFFQKTIIIGSFVYDFGGLLSALSFTFNRKIFGLEGVEPYLICCLLDIIIFSAAFGYRIKMLSDEKNSLLQKDLNYQLELEKVRIGIASDLHDNIGATLSSIHIYTDSVQKNIEKGNMPVALKILNQISNDCRESIDNMSDIVWAINPKNESLNRMTVRMKSFTNNILGAKGIKSSFSIDDQIEKQDWEMIKRKNTYLIFKEAINNASKYSNATEIQIKIYTELNQIILEIIDNGIGFNANNQYHGNGLGNMQNRAIEMNGELKIISKENEGCQIKLII